MNRELNGVFSKIRKLLNLADPSRGGTPDEVATAASKAQQLLLEHNLTVEDLGSPEEEAEKIGKETINLEATYLTSPWHASLIHGISSPLMCRVIYHPAKAGKAGRVSIVGEKGNVEVLKYFYTYLYRTIDKMAVDFREGWKKRKEKRGEKYIPDESFRIRVDFCIGATNTVVTRMRDTYNKVKTTGKTTAVAVRVDQALDERYEHYFPKRTNASTSRKIDITARMAGIEAGNKIALTKGIASMAQDRKAGSMSACKLT